MSDSDDFIKNMIESKSSSAVLKYKLIAFKSSMPNALVFVMEGINDKIVYYHWTKRIKHQLRYEPFPCGGKKEVLKLRKTVHEDEDRLKENVYFFVDRDFDDLQGMEPCRTIFMTDCYSIENYLVQPEVIDEILKNELHYHGLPEIRGRIVEDFFARYDEFLAVTADANRLIYAARKNGLGVKMPERINQLAKVGLRSVAGLDVGGQMPIVLERPIDDAELEQCGAEFRVLDPRTRYRGKFAVLFCLHWLRLLVADRNSAAPSYGDALEGQGEKVKEITFESLAAKAPFPEGLADFLLVMPVAA